MVDDQKANQTAKPLKEVKKNKHQFRKSGISV
jgi:hypothetical protein